MWHYSELLPVFSGCQPPLFILGGGPICFQLGPDRDLGNYDYQLDTGTSYSMPWETNMNLGTIDAVMAQSCPQEPDGPLTGLRAELSSVAIIVAPITEGAWTALPRLLSQPIMLVQRRDGESPHSICNVVVHIRLSREANTKCSCPFYCQFYPLNVDMPLRQAQ